ncbi:TetR/AcrR family transcriptional regulator [Gordonia oryzae]|nr:TetR/AcrR family transcriptional regulator [Gordonia oryzae]
MTTAPATSVADRLLDAAEKLLADKGIRATTMQQVADVAGVSRGWLYRHFPDKQSMVGATIVRLTDSFWSDARVELETLGDFTEQLVAGVRIGRGAYDDPGTLLLRLRTEEPEEFAACAGVGVSALVPDLALLWKPFVDTAIENGEVHPDHDAGEVSEWVARILISLGTVSGTTVDADDPASVRRQVERFVIPGLAAAP